MDDEIKLRKVGEIDPLENKLPRGVHAVIINDEVYFVRKVAGGFVPLPEDEQLRLKQKHVL